MALAAVNAGDGDLGRYISPRKKRCRPKPKLQPPLTPMIDVTFQLLLFFILTTQFRMAEGQIPGTLPQGQLTGGRVADIYKPIEILLRLRVDPAGSVVTGLYEVSGSSGPVESAERLYRLLQARSEYLGTTEAPVIIKAPSAIPWQFVVEAMNAANRAKFKRIGYARPPGATKL